ncbi:hypothetical protein QWY82_11285 [Simiduia curdlanivorans]|uniref:Uncharacterized protein n=1 Tax=Simiduia curdlanivorans TaxID=1492769 RepID=A0ABV8VB33_9GAMM|nr:hypothetical protein [Simiduia curdlanivorans]MDN3639388.1 hypothetical protein [Simiduia curdlanivorans]
MPTPIELALMRTRKNAAKSALLFFKEKKSVKSTNNFFDFTSENDQNTLDTYRGVAARNTIVDAFDDAATTGIGNCDEKGRICYSALSSNPLLQPPGSVVTLCEAIHYDHVFVVVANVAVVGPTSLGGLGLTAMVVDGWTQDWYFPNLGLWDAKKNNLGNTPNPRQGVIRVKVNYYQFQAYTMPAIM